MEQILPLLVAIPLGIGFLVPILEKLDEGKWLADTGSFMGTAVLLLLSLLTLAIPDTKYWLGGWSDARTIGICLSLDGLTRLLLITVNLISFVAVVFSYEYMKRYTSKPLYYSLLMIMLAGMNGVVLTGDMFNLYVFIEVASIASYALVAFGTESEELEASLKYLVLSAVASAFILFGIAMLYNITGTLNMGQISQILPTKLGSRNAVLLATAFFLVGFGLKSAMVPFHAWLPDAHPSAPAPISAMLSGVVIKALGVYAIIRVVFDVVGLTVPFARVMIALGLVSMVVGMLMALGQWDYKRLLAYSSVANVGYIMLAVGVGGELLARGARTETALLAIFAGLFHLLNHSVAKSLMFLSSGAVVYSAGTRDMRKLGALTRRMPVTGWCARVGALTLGGIPPFSLFWSKLLIIIAVVRAGHPLLASVAVFVTFISLTTFVKVQRYLLHGELPENLSEIREVPATMCAAMIILSVVCIGAGILIPIYGTQLITPATRALAEFAQTVLVMK